MSVKYVPVQWNRNKWRYDGIMLAAVLACLILFLEVSPGLLSHEKPINGAIHNARAFGLCAFLMLTAILCIGPLARLDARFLPLLYNRRHFGVMTLFVALTHAWFVLGWYYAFSPTPRWEALLSANTSFTRFLGFPFEALGLFALICLMALALTSHDFWLKFLTPRIWKAVHYLIYPAYAAVVGHVALGAMQDAQHPGLAGVVGVCAGAVVALHLLAARREATGGGPGSGSGAWVEVCRTEEIAEGFARIALLENGERVAVFRQDGLLSAISNACAHQNGPLGEGKVIRCLVTCPWHGFQYDVRTGRSPAPFTEMVPTYRLKVRDGVVLVDPEANPPGTPVDPVPVEGAP